MKGQRDPVALYESVKARKKDGEYITVSELVVMRDSIDALGETKNMGSTYFSVPLNQGFYKPYNACAKYIRRCRKDLEDGKRPDSGLTQEDLDFEERFPVLYLRSESHGLKPIARAMSFMDAGVRLEFCVKICKAYDDISYTETVSNLTDNDRSVIDKFNSIGRKMWI